MAVLEKAEWEWKREGKCGHHDIRTQLVLLFFCFYLFVCFLFFSLFIFLNWRLITLQYCSGFAYINMNLLQVYVCSPSWTPLPPPGTGALGLSLYYFSLMPRGVEYRGNISSILNQRMDDIVHCADSPQWIRNSNYLLTAL